MTDCKNAYRPTNTTGDVVDQLVTTRGALDECAVKVACVREWRKKTDTAYVPPAEWLQCVDPEKPETTVVVGDGKPLKPLPRPKIKAKAGAKAVPKAAPNPVPSATAKAKNPKRRAPMKPIPEEKIKDALPLR